MAVFGSFTAVDHPGRVILTDDPLRARMLAAHHLEYAVLLYEQEDVLLYSGSYKEHPIALVSTGFGQGAILDYIHDAKRFGVEEILYIGECLSTSRRHVIRSVILADGGDPSLMARACRAATQFNIHSGLPYVFPENEITEDFDGVADSVTGDFYAHAKAENIAALSVLTVTKNTVSGEQMEEHERRSRLYAAARLVFEVFALN